MGATNQRDDAEDSTSRLEQKNEELQAQIDDLRDEFDAAPGTTSASGAPSTTTTPSQGCGSPDIDVSPDQTTAGVDFDSTVSGECFLPGEHLRISLADDAEFCNDIMCTALTDVDATPAGVLDPVIIQVQVAGKYELQQPGTIFIRVEHSGEGEGSEASEPLQVVLR